LQHQSVEPDAAVDLAASSKLGLYHGAGAILNSRLCYSGWRFPACSLSDSDSALLFDIEVKIKLRHETASSEVWNLLTNFPVEAILPKVNILHEMLDSIGGPSNYVDKGYWIDFSLLATIH